MQVDTFKYYGINIAIYKTYKGYTINNIDFYQDINEVKTSCKTLVKQILGKNQKEGKILKMLQKTIMQQY